MELAEPKIVKKAGCDAMRAGCAFEPREGWEGAWRAELWGLIAGRGLSGYE